MLSSSENAILMSEFMNLLILFILKKTSKSSFSRMLEFTSDLTFAKNKKKMSMRLIIDDLSEINIVDDLHRQTLTDQKVIHFAALNTAFTAAVFAISI